MLQAGRSTRASATSPQGNSSAVAGALSDAVDKHNERNPGTVDRSTSTTPRWTRSSPTRKCSFWHFRFDADSDMKMEALTNYMAKDQKIKKVYLINQNYSFGQAVSARGEARCSRASGRTSQIVGDDLHPLGQVKDFAPYVAKIKASGADTVDHRQLGQRHVAAGQGRQGRRPATSTSTPTTPASPACRRRWAKRASAT